MRDIAGVLVARACELVWKCDSAARLVDRLLPRPIRALLVSRLYDHYVHCRDMAGEIDDRQPEGLALIFHMGLGDALFATPLLRECKARWPSLPVWAYVSSTLDAVNSPVVAELLELLPYIDKVVTWPGCMRDIWVNYDRSEVCVPEGFLRVPLLWKTTHDPIHRTEQLFLLWGLPVPEDITPVLPGHVPLTPRARELADQTPQGRKIAVVHLDTRSSEYCYPHGEALAERLVRNGWTVVCFTKLDRPVAGVVHVDPRKNTLVDTIAYLMHLRQREGTRIRALCVQSMFWPLLASMGVPALGVNITEDKGIHAYWNSSVTVLSPWRYKGVRYPFFHDPAVRMRRYRSSYAPRLFTVADYPPETLVRYFEKMD